MFDDLIGKTFKNGGRGPEEFDCWGLTKEVYRRIGIELPDFNISALDAEAVETEMKLHIGDGVWRRCDASHPYAVAAIRWDHKHVSHTGVVIAPGLVLHIAVKTKSCIERLNNPLFRSMIEGFYRYDVG